MSRRRRPRRKKVNNSIVIVQIGILAVTLVIVLFFRDKVGLTASNFMNAFGGSEDIQVDAPNTNTSPSAPHTPPNSTAPSSTTPRER